MSESYLKDMFIDEVKGALSKNGSSTAGVSPTVTVSDIDGGHRITVTDVNGDTTFDVMDGATGATGPQGEKGEKGDTGATGAAGTDGKTPVKGTDYWTEEDKQEIVDEVVAALDSSESSTTE